jgi:hypothetical protein
MRLAALQRADARVDHRFGRVKIRLADAQREHIFHGRGDIEEFADARRFQRRNAVGNIRFLFQHFTCHFPSLEGIQKMDRMSNLCSNNAGPKAR